MVCWMTAGIRIHLPDQAATTARRVLDQLHGWLNSLGLSEWVTCSIGFGLGWVLLNLAGELQAAPWALSCDTLGLCTAFGDGNGNGLDLAQETVLAMLFAPLPLTFPNLAELQSHVRIRVNIADTARKAELRFDTDAVDRPDGYWHYDEDHGFLLKEGQPLVEALTSALIPDASGRTYSFSCYRASEYVVLLGIARELEATHPALLEALEARWRTRPIASRRFHDAFVHEVGSAEAPVPMHYYIPGDRVWFRNPDEASSDVSGYEGSWVIYLGGGKFANFWQRGAPFDLRGKCLEVYFWRDALRVDAQGNQFIDEARVTQLRAQVAEGSALEASILQRMRRYRDASGTYRDGGCIDSTREFVNFIHSGAPRIQFDA
ncbi:hypothetical protein [Simplicispira hankyongi]|nr:hypothetical protein [Simplicispira hankyongi]